MPAVTPAPGSHVTIEALGVTSGRWEPFLNAANGRHADSAARLSNATNTANMADWGEKLKLGRMACLTPTLFHEANASPLNILDVDRTDGFHVVVFLQTLKPSSRRSRLKRRHRWTSGKAKTTRTMLRYMLFFLTPISQAPRVGVTG